MREGEEAHPVLASDTGALLTTLQAKDDARTERMFAALENLLVVTSRSITLYDPFTAEHIWRLERERPIFAHTVQVDLDGVYFSDDGRHMVKIDLENRSIRPELAAIGIVVRQRAADRNHQIGLRQAIPCRFR